MQCPQCHKKLNREIGRSYSWLCHSPRSKCQYQKTDYKKIQWGLWVPIEMKMTNGKYAEIREYMEANGYIDKENQYRLPDYE